MKLPWIIAAASLGVAAYVVLNNSKLQSATSNGPAEDAANKTGVWGTKQRVEGTGGGLLGEAKQGVGKVTGDKQMQGEGVLDEALGNVKNAAGKAANAVSDKIQDLSKS